MTGSRIRFLILLLATSLTALAQSEKTADVGAPKPLATLEVGERTYSNVTLKSSDANNATVTHDAGIKTIPLTELTLDQMKALNATTSAASIDLTKVDPNPPSKEVIKQVDRWIAQAGGPNRRLENGNTPLIEAVLTGEINYVKVAIRRRVDVNGTNKEGNTAWREAAVRGYSEIAAMLEKAGAKVPNLIASAQSGDIDTINIFMAKDPKSSEQTDSSGRTVLMLAARAGQDKAIAALAAGGAALEARDPEGKTPLIHAAETGKTAAAQALADAGADLNGRDNNGATALMAAAESGSLDVMKLLIDRGANMRAADRQEGWNALMRAVKKNNIDAARLLIERGIRLDAIDRRGNTALQIAQTANLSDMVAVLTAAEQDAGKAKSERQKSFKRVQGTELAVLGEEEVRRQTLPRYVPFLLWAGLLIALAGHVWLTLVAIQDGLVWGLAVLFLNPLGGAAYCFGRVRGAIPIFSIYLLGALMVAVPAWLYDVNLFEFYLQK